MVKKVSKKKKSLLSIIMVAKTMADIYATTLTSFVIFNIKRDTTI